MARIAAQLTGQRHHQHGRASDGMNHSRALSLFFAGKDWRLQRSECIDFLVMIGLWTSNEQ